MSFPRVRFTVRRLMVAVAAVAVVLGLVAELSQRRERYRRIASYHEEVNRPYFLYPGYYYPLDQILWHGEMQRKYDRAARYPWLPVEPDPPEPPSPFLPPLNDPLGIACPFEEPERN